MLFVSIVFGFFCVGAADDVSGGVGGACGAGCDVGGCGSEGGGDDYSDVGCGECYCRVGSSQWYKNSFCVTIVASCPSISITIRWL